MAKLSAAEQVERGKELTPARLLAFKLWKENPQITAAELDKALKEKGFEIGKTTRITWLARFKKGKGVRTYEGKPLTAVKPSEITLGDSRRRLGASSSHRGGIHFPGMGFRENLVVPGTPQLRSPDGCTGTYSDSVKQEKAPSRKDIHLGKRSSCARSQLS